MHTHVCAFVQWLDKDIGYLSLWLPFSFEKRSFTKLELDWWPASLWGPPTRKPHKLTHSCCLLPPNTSAGWQVYVTTLDSLHGFWDLNSDPHACMAITFTPPSLQPLSCLRDWTESWNQYKPARCSLWSFTVASTHRLHTIEMKFHEGTLCSQCPCQAPFHQMSAGSNLVTVT